MKTALVINLFFTLLRGAFLILGCIAFLLVCFRYRKPNNKKSEIKTVTLCGSMRFAEQMKDIAFMLETQYGYNILQCTYGESDLSAEEKENIIKAHYKKIDISDAVYIVDIEGYIGESVKKEMEYAKRKNKQIIYHSKFIQQ